MTNNRRRLCRPADLALEWAVACALAVVVPGCATATLSPKEFAPRIDLVRRDADRRVDVLVDGKPFTSYVHLVTATTLEAPVLFPLRTDRGTLVTRGFPFEPRPGERMDHPHHFGMWLAYGDVEGVDFWDSGSPPGYKRRKTNGKIVHGAITKAEGGAGRGTLAVTADWILPGDRKALREETVYVFHGSAGRRAVDRATTLVAVDGPIKFGDTKEGMFAVRVTRALDHPSSKPDLFVGADGKPGKEKTVETSGHGRYRSSEGVEGENVWGTRARWMMLSADVNGEPVTLAILDHPTNPGYPTHWHARPYGLFSANPIGVNELTGGKTPPMDFVIAEGKPVRFAYRIVILSHLAKPDEAEKEWSRFVAEVK